MQDSLSKFTFLVTILLFFAPTFAFAQDQDSLDAVMTQAAEKNGVQEKREGQWDLSVAAGFNLTDGNNDTLLANLRAEATREKDSDIYRLTADGNLGEVENERTQESFKAAAEYKRLLSERFYLGLRAAYETDGIADIDYRTTIDPHVGYFFVKNDELELSAEVGPSYVFEKLGGVKDDFLGVRAAERFDWKFSETAKLYQTAEYVISTDSSDDYFFNGEVGVEASLTTRLSLVVALKDSYVNEPAPGFERNDLSVLSALKVAL